MKKKVLVLLVTLSMTIGNVLPVYAMDETEVNQTQETNEFETTVYEAQESCDIETEAVDVYKRQALYCHEDSQKGIAECDAVFCEII